MKTIAIVLVLLIASTQATSLFDKFPINFGPKRSIMTLLTQVEAHLKAGGPLDAVTKLLEDFVKAVTDEQIQHDQLYAQQQAECASEFEFREREVADATAAFQAASETLDGCVAQNVRAEADLAQTKQDLASTQSYLETLVDTRRREQYAFETATEVYQRVSAAVDEALVILEEIWSGAVSFAQIAKKANSMLKDSVKIRKAHLLAPVMSALAQLASSESQADNAVLERVKNLLLAYRVKVEEEYQVAAAAEGDAVNVFTETKARVDANIATLTQQQLDLETEISDLGKCIVTQTGIKSSAAAKRDRNAKLLEDAQALCTSVEEEYKSSTESRKQELSLLAQIKERVEARFSQLSEGVKSRGVQDEWAHENTYVGLLQSKQERTTGPHSP